MTAIHFLDTPGQQQPAQFRYTTDFADAQLRVYARGAGTVLRVDGEIDASNAHDVMTAIRRFARLKTPLVLDFSNLLFLSVEGFRALLALNAEFRKARVHCGVVTGPAIQPLVRIVSDNGLPLAGSLPEALQVIEDLVRARRALLSGLVGHREPRRQLARIASF